MKNFTQKALFVVLTVFVLVGMFYGLSTPVKASSAASVNPALPSPHEGPVPVPCGDPTPIPACIQ